MSLFLLRDIEYFEAPAKQHYVNAAGKERCLAPQDGSSTYLRHRIHAHHLNILVQLGQVANSEDASLLAGGGMDHQYRGVARLDAGHTHLVRESQSLNHCHDHHQAIRQQTYDLARQIVPVTVFAAHQI